ncbi:MAG TPA: Gfo/Idh/MocA family oxidoreductase [Planctomycetota bacterium]|nr:Gfo/Idh/MocA family oxidoreductase [Planctomycetota bacterium]
MLDRRTFLGMAAGGAALAAAPASARPQGANERIVVGVMGCSRSNSGRNPGRGSTLAIGLAALPGAEVAYVCDVDEKYLAAVTADVSAKQARPPKAVKDFRRILDDKSVDALVIATPDHWHAPAAILGCAAGKHVYVEKPCSHNAREGQLLVAAARKHRRVVQHGTQRRSWASHREAIQTLREGAIGKVLTAKAYYLFSDRPSIGKGMPAPVPEHLDWALWQGPAPEREYRDNVVHYNWHWFWHWGTSELGNNGVHVVDVCRWGLGVDYPVQVSSMGGKLRYDDDQETPDTNIVSFKFENNLLLTWEGKSWGGRTPADPAHQIAFFGDRGTLTISGTQYSIKDLSGAEVAKGQSNASDAVHLQNFLDGIRGTAPLNAEIEEGFKSTLLCHLGNISYRTGRTLRFDPKARAIEGDREAMNYWSREYRSGWEPKV